MAEEVVRPRYLPGGGVEQDPAELLDSVLAAGRGAGRGAGRPSTPSRWPTRARRSWPGTATPAGRCRGDRLAGPPRRDVCARAGRRRGRRRARTGLVLDPYFSAPKMAGCAATSRPAGVVTTTDTWLVHQLPERSSPTPSTASRSLLTSTWTQAEWDAELLALFGLADEALPDIVG